MRAGGSVALAFAIIAATATSVFATSPVLTWSADHETGTLSQWTNPQDSGFCERPESGVSTAVARSGRYSVPHTIDTSAGSAGCRTGRQPEPLSGAPYHYGAWFYIPQHTSVTGNFWNIFQFKSRTPTAGGSDPFWLVYIENRKETGAMHLVLRWRADFVEGPFVGDGKARRSWTQSLVDVPVGRWFHIEAYLRQSGGYDGRITVWQDGIELWDLEQVRTKHPDGDQRWYVNNYSDGLSPSPNTLYVDDATVGLARFEEFDSALAG